MYLLGEFREKTAAAAAIRSLCGGGIRPADLDIFSEEPVASVSGLLRRRSRMSAISAAGAVASGALATAFIHYTQHNYKLVTGGMPLFSFWATGVITFEMIMMGAILATFAWFLWESGLVRRRDTHAPVPVADPGSLYLRVRCDPAKAHEAGEAMRRSGAVSIEQRDEA